MRVKTVSQVGPHSFRFGLSAHPNLASLPAIQELTQRQKFQWTNLSNLCMIMLIAGMLLDALSIILVTVPIRHPNRPIDVESLPTAARIRDWMNYI